MPKEGDIRTNPLTGQVETFTPEGVWSSSALEQQVGVLGEKVKEVGIQTSVLAEKKLAEVSEITGQQPIKSYDVDVASPTGERLRISTSNLAEYLGKGFKVVPTETTEIKVDEFGRPISAIPAEILEEGEETLEQKQFREAQESFKNLDIQQQRLQSELDILRTSERDGTEDLKRQIQLQYQARREQMTEINRRSLAQLKTGLMRMGTARYAESVALSLSTFEETQGMVRLAEITAEENRTIAELKKAQSEKDYDILLDSMDRLDKIRDEKIEEMKNLNKIINENNKKVKEKEIQSSIDLSVATLISNGIIDPARILSLVKGATTEDIIKAMKLYSANEETTSDGNLTADLKTFKYLQDNELLPEEITSLDKTKQYFAYMNYLKEGNIEGKKVIGPTVKIGVGAKDLAEETVVRARLTSKLMNILNKGQLSDSDRAVINESITILRDAGYSEQEIMDNLSGFATDVLTPYNEKFRNLIVANTKDNAAQTDQMSKVSLLLNNDDYLQAMKTVENLAMLNAKQTDPDNYLGIATANNYLRIIKEIKDKLATAGIVGFVEGNFQKILGRLKGKEATQIRADLTRLYSQFRRETAGTAVTENELKFLDPLFADINDPKGNFLTKLDSFERNVKDRHNASRLSVGLPEVNIEEVLNENKRIRLYESSLPTEVDARNRILEYGNDNPNDRTLINDLLNNIDPTLGRILTYDEVYQYLKQLGKIQ